MKSSHDARASVRARQDFGGVSTSEKEDTSASLLYAVKAIGGRKFGGFGKASFVSRGNRLRGRLQWLTF